MFLLTIYTSRLKYEQITINVPIFSNHSIGDEIRPIPPEINF